MIFAQLYRGAPGAYTEATGDRSVVVLDGRQAAWTHHDIASDFARRHGFDAYALHRGASFTQSRRVTDIFPITRS